MAKFKKKKKEKEKTAISLFLSTKPLSFLSPNNTGFNDGPGLMTTPPSVPWVRVQFNSHERVYRDAFTLRGNE